LCQAAFFILTRHRNLFVVYFLCLKIIILKYDKILIFNTSQCFFFGLKLKKKTMINRIISFITTKKEKKEFNVAIEK
jgi:hypothetical protein